MGAPALLEVGHVGRAHGLRGEVVVVLTSDRAERLAPGARLYAGDQPLTVATARRDRARWLVRFAGITDRAGAARLQGARLLADAMPATDGELWVHELVGAAVEDRRGVALGRVVALEANPAADLLVVERSGHELLVPLTFVTRHEPGRVVVDPPPGLLEL